MELAEHVSTDISAQKKLLHKLFSSVMSRPQVFYSNHLMVHFSSQSLRILVSYNIYRYSHV